MAVLSYGPDPTNVVGRRVVAWIVDGVINSVVLVGLIAVTGVWNDVAVDARGNTLLTPRFIGLLLVSTLGWALVKMVLIANYGWTPGKLLLGLRIVGWDGRPPGYGKAFGRSLFFGFFENFGCLYTLPALLVAMSSVGHRQPADFVANTYVIDAVYQGRLVMRTDGRTAAGPESVTAEEIAEYRAAQGQPAVLPPPGKKVTEPYFDKARGTYVVFSTKRDEWMQFDDASGTWVPLQ